MLALLRNALSAAFPLSKVNRQVVSDFGFLRLFTSSQTRSKFLRPQPTDDELAQMSRTLMYYYRTRNDPVSHQKRIERVRVFRAKSMQTDPEYRQKEAARQRRYREAHPTSATVREIKCLDKWLRRIPASQRKAYAWRTHLPIMFPESRRLKCSVCSDNAKKSRLWWERLNSHSAAGTSDAKQYTCHSCYTEQDMSEILPRGLEHHVFGSGKKCPKP